MRTLSHAVLAAALRAKTGTETSAKRGDAALFLAASVLPDAPLFVLTTWTLLASPSRSAGMARMHFNYETNPLWIALHNTPHSFVVWGAVALLGYVLSSGLATRWGRGLLWFAAGAALHTLIDVFTHAGDGPLFLFPVTTYRFESPVSYWDPAYYGRVFTVLEYSLDTLLLAYLGVNWWRRTVKKPTES